jgi:hypothetical protein
MRASPPEKRFWAKVDKDGPGGCWIWTGALVRGYGQTSIHGRKRVYTHRFSWELHRGPIPPGLVLDHLCRNPPCCNPDHLEPVTNLENLRRAVRPVRTHCKRGHPVSEMYTNPQGERQCRTCKRLWDAAHRSRPRRP